MSAKPLQSSLASLEAHRVAPYIKWGATVVGGLVVLIGAADVASRVATATFGSDAGQVLFAPAAAIGSPEILSAVSTPVPDNFTPVRIKVPSVGIDAKVVPVGTRADGAMATPGTLTDVAWYKDGTHPGQAGNAVFAGHVNNGLTTAGVFAPLSKVAIGDYITLADKEGKALVYKVSALDQYPADEAPAASIFTTTGPSHIVLITCDGDWVPAQKTFDKRLVITATPMYTAPVR